MPALLRMVQDRPPASILALDGEGRLEPLVAGLLQQDPLIALNLNLIGLNVYSGAGLELIQREGWTAGAPRWCLMAPDGTVLFSSGSPPTPSMIMDAFRSAGLHSRQDILRRFLANHPGHAEAKLALLGELRAVAETKTRVMLGLLGRQSGSQAGGLGSQAIGAGASASPPLIQLLDSAVDGEIWGEYARESDGAFQAGIWKEDTDQLWGRGSARMTNAGPFGGLFRGGGTSMVSNLGQHSPTMKRLYNRWLPDIEYALLRRPTSYQLWDFWLVVQRVAGGRDLGEIIANIVPGPDDRNRDIPPSAIRRDWIRDCINRHDWRMAEDVARVAWEHLLVAAADSANRSVQAIPMTGGRARGGYMTPLNSSAWTSILEPYLEVLLRQQKTSIADAVVQHWFNSDGWLDAAQRARNLANRMGFPELGNRWGSYAPARR
ncbi:MAG: hypothetical protein FWG12_00450 [Holophagaceae bacterium]|nr:hypothetical protein [Holophagaceae bacterium]